MVKKDKYKKASQKFWSGFGDDWEKAKYLIIGKYVDDKYWYDVTPKLHWDEFLNGINLEKDWTVLDYGCGVGRTIRLIAPYVKLAIGVDVSTDMIKMSKKYLQDLPNVQTYETNGVDLSIFPDCKFDFVFEKSVFQHIPDTETIIGILRETSRVLKPAGIARMNFAKPTGSFKLSDILTNILRKPTLPSLLYLKKYLFNRKKDDWHRTWHGKKLSFAGNSFSEDSVKRLLNVSGLCLSTLESFSQSPSWWWVTCSPNKQSL